MSLTAHFANIALDVGHTRAARHASHPEVTLQNIVFILNSKIRLLSHLYSKYTKTYQVCILIKAGAYCNAATPIQVLGSRAEVRTCISIRGTEPPPRRTDAGLVSTELKLDTDFKPDEDLKVTARSSVGNVIAPPVEYAKKFED